MPLPDQCLQPFIHHVGINLGRRDVRMAEHLLDRAKISPMSEQMAGKGVTQYMRRYLGGVDLRFHREFLQKLSQAVACQVSAGATAREQPAVIFFALQKLSANLLVVGDGLASGSPQSNEPFPPSLAADQHPVRVPSHPTARQ